LANTAILFGGLLIVLGLGGYFGTGRSSLTALIPAVFGLLLGALGFMARDAAKRKTAMHIAAAVALLGFIACVPGLFKLPMLMAGETIARPAAVVSQSIMALLTGIFVVLAIKSFRDARKARDAAAKSV
jgi:hypothetical protein